MKLVLVLACLSFGIAPLHRSTAFATTEFSAIAEHSGEFVDTLCMRVMLPDSLLVLSDHYIDDKTLLRLRDELAPVISDTTKLPGHPRRALQVLGARVPAPDYAAWWPTRPDSVALFWRFGFGRAVYVAAALGDGDLSGRLFLTVGERHEGPIAFSAERVACMTPPAA
jgi:hypothetical protein